MVRPQLYYLVKNYLILNAGKTLGVFFSFMLIPIYTRSLTKEQYGLLELSLTAIFFMSSLSSMGIPQLIGVEFARLGEEAWGRVSKLNSIHTRVSLPLLVLVGVFFYSSNLPELKEVTLPLVLIIIASSFFLYYRSAYTAVMVHTSKVPLLSITEMSYGILNFSMNYLVLVVFEIVNVSIILISQLISGLLYFFISKKLKDKETRSDFSIDLKIIWEEARISFPLSLTVLCSWVLTSCDRWIIAGHMSLDDVGTYSLSFRLASIYQFFIVTSVSVLFSPIIYRSFKSVGLKSTYKRIMLLILSLTIVTAAVALLFSLFGHALFLRLIGEEFLGSFSYINPLIFCFYMGCLTIFVNYIFIYTKKTKLTLLMYVIGALTNFFTNHILIEDYGLKGVVMATFLSYVIMVFYGMVMNYRVSKTLLKEVSL